MKKRLNLWLGLALLTTLGSGYATCYLNQVKVCLHAGDSLGPWTITYMGSTFYTTVYAYEQAYMVDTYTPASGGRNNQFTASNTYYCTSDSTVFDYTGSANNTFAVYYYNPYTGQTGFPDQNGPSWHGGTGDVDYKVTSHYTDNGIGSACP